MGQVISFDDAKRASNVSSVDPPVSVRNNVTTAEAAQKRRSLVVFLGVSIKTVFDHARFARRLRPNDGTTDMSSWYDPVKVYRELKEAKDSAFKRLVREWLIFWSATILILGGTTALVV